MAAGGKAQGLVGAVSMAAGGWPDARRMKERGPAQLGAAVRTRQHFNSRGRCLWGAGFKK